MQRPAQLLSRFPYRATNKFYLTDTLSCAMMATIFDYDKTMNFLNHGQWKEDADVANQDRLVRDHRVITGLALKWFPQTTATRHNLAVYFIQCVLSQISLRLCQLIVHCRHVVSNAVCVDLAVLIPFIEEVASQLILNHFWHYTRGRYNGLTLPRSWIVRVFFRGASERPNGRMPYLLIPALQSLLEILCGRRFCGGQDFLLYLKHSAYLDSLRKLECSR